MRAEVNKNPMPQHRVKLDRLFTTNNNNNNRNGNNNNNNDDDDDDDEPAPIVSQSEFYCFALTAISSVLAGSLFAG